MLPLQSLKRLATDWELAFVPGDDMLTKIIHFCVWVSLLTSRALTPSRKSMEKTRANRASLTMGREIRDRTTREWEEDGGLECMKICRGRSQRCFSQKGMQWDDKEFKQHVTREWEEEGGLETHEIRIKFRKRQNVTIRGRAMKPMLFQNTRSCRKLIYLLGTASFLFDYWTMKSSTIVGDVPHPIKTTLWNSTEFFEFPFTIS